MKRVHSLSALLISLFLVLTLTVPASAFFDSKFEKEVEKEKAAVKLARETKRGGYDLVTVTELKNWIDQGKDMVLVDTMPYEASYKKAHVPTAEQFLFPIPEMTSWDSENTGGKTVEDFKALLGEDMEKTVVIYCGFVKCTRSHNGAMWAEKLGYENVYRFSGGIYAWKGAGFEAAKVE